jgi:hypothetical protein
MYGIKGVVLKWHIRYISTHNVEGWACLFFASAEHFLWHVCMHPCTLDIYAYTYTTQRCTHIHVSTPNVEGCACLSMCMLQKSTSCGMHACMHTHTYKQISIHRNAFFVLLHGRFLWYACICMHACMCVCMSVCVYVCIRTHPRTHIHAHEISGMCDSLTSDLASVRTYI